MFNHILVAADGSPYSERAAQKAVIVAKANEHATITIVYVVDSSTTKKDVLQSLDAYSRTERRKTKLTAVESIIKQSAVAYKLEILHGSPGETIVDYAKQHNVDLVVIGSRGLNTLQEMVLGSVSHKVTKRADCPVMVVK